MISRMHHTAQLPTKQLGGEHILAVSRSGLSLNVPWLRSARGLGPRLFWRTTTAKRSCAPWPRDKTAFQRKSRIHRMLHKAWGLYPSDSSCCRCLHTPRDFGNATVRLSEDCRSSGDLFRAMVNEPHLAQCAQHLLITVCDSVCCHEQRLGAEHDLTILGM